MWKCNILQHYIKRGTTKNNQPIKIIDTLKYSLMCGVRVGSRVKKYFTFSNVVSCQPLKGKLW